MNNYENNEEQQQAILYPIVLSEYNPAWIEWYAEEKANLEQLIGMENIARISHFGSTSVPGLMAKPTVDILLEIRDDTDINKLIQALSSPDYIYLQQESAPTISTPLLHLMFLKGYLDDGYAKKVYHIHVVHPGDWDEKLCFRDYLISHPETAAEYAELKRSLFKEYKHDHDGYTKAKTEFISSITQKAAKNETNQKMQQLPTESIIEPKDKIAEFSGEKWPFSNVEPAIYAALTFSTGKPKTATPTVLLVNSDLEYSIHNVLTGHAFGLFNCLPDISLSMGMYGFSSSHIDIGDVSEDEIMTAIKTNICCGNVVHIDEGNGPFDYLIWGYKDNGNILLGYRFEHGDDMGNCAFNFGNPMEFDSLAKSFSDATLYKMNGEKPGGITIIRPDGVKQDKMTLYKRALADGHRMLTQTDPAPAMDFARVHFGYGQAIYDEWTRQIEEMEKANCGDFLYISPIFPHFIALYENRLHLWRFLNHLNTLKADEKSLKTDEQSLKSEDLQKAADLCGQLKDIAADAATVTMDGDWNPLRDASNHEKRILLLDSLAKSRALELEIGESIRKAIGG